MKKITLILLGLCFANLKSPFNPHESQTPSRSCEVINFRATQFLTTGTVEFADTSYQLNIRPSQGHCLGKGFEDDQKLTLARLCDFIDTLPDYLLKERFTLRAHKPGASVYIKIIMQERPAGEKIIRLLHAVNAALFNYTGPFAEKTLSPFMSSEAIADDLLYQIKITLTEKYPKVEVESDY